MSWYIYESVPGKTHKAVEHMRQRGIEVIHLMAFIEARVHPNAKAKKPILAKPRAALSNYTCVRVENPIDRFNIDTLPVRTWRMKRGREAAPELSAAGRAFFMNPPRGLFYDTDVARIQKAGSIKPEFRSGDRVGVFSHGFTGLRGEVVSVSRDGLKVRFEDNMFEFNVQPELAVKVA